MSSTAEPGDLGGPLRRARQDVRLDLGVEIGEPREIGAIDQALGQQHVHDGQRQRGIGAGLQHQRQVRLLDGGRAVDVDHHQLGAALLCARGPRASSR